jgi:hypothetical protein
VAAVMVLCLAGPASGAPVENPEDLPVLKELDLKGVTLEQAFDRLRQAAGVDLVVHWPVLEAMEFERGMRVNLHLHDVRVDQALDLLLVRIGGRDVPLEWTLRDGRIVVTSTNDERSRLTRVFDLRGLIETMRRTSHEQDLPVTWLEAEDELLRFLTEHVDPDGWADAGGSSGNTRMLWGRLVVTHEKPEVMREVEALLARLQVILSQPSPKPPPAATRPAAEEVDPPSSPLWARKIPDLDLTDTTLKKALDRLREVTGLDVVVQWPVLEAAGVERKAAIDLRLRNVTAEWAFDAVLTSAGDGTVLLRAEEENGRVTVSTDEAFMPPPARFYDVRDLLSASEKLRKNGFPGPGGREGTRIPTEDELIRLITENVAPDSWRDAGGSHGSIRVLWGRLVVTQTRSGHRSLRKFLDELRREFIRPEEVAPPATSPSAPAPPAPRRAGG